MQPGSVPDRRFHQRKQLAEWVVAAAFALSPAQNRTSIGGVVSPECLVDQERRDSLLVAARRPARRTAGRWWNRLPGRRSPRSDVCGTGCRRSKRQPRCEPSSRGRRRDPRPPGLELETLVMSLREARGLPFRPALLMLAAATGLVLLQLLTESVVLSIAGGAVGPAVAVGIARAAPALVPRNVPGFAEVGIDGAVLAFTAAVSIITGLLFGTLPALAWSRVDLARTLNESGASARGFGRLRANRGQAALAVSQVALALMLLPGAGLLLHSFVALVTLDLGFEPSNVVGARIMDPAGSGVFLRGGRIGPDEVQEMNEAARLASETLLARLERIAELPGVDAVALSSSMPLDPAGPILPVEVAGRPAPTDPRERLQAGIRTVSPGYADVMRLRLQAGRFFTDRDAAGSPRVAMVSESFAREAFGREAALGQRLVSAIRFRPGFGRGASGPPANRRRRRARRRAVGGHRGRSRRHVSVRPGVLAAGRRR